MCGDLRVLKAALHYLKHITIIYSNIVILLSFPVESLVTQDLVSLSTKTSTISFHVTSLWRHTRQNSEKQGKWQILFLTIKILGNIWFSNGLFSLRLIGPTMFGATFNLVARVGLPYFLEHRQMVVFKLINYSTQLSASFTFHFMIMEVVSDST